MGHSRKKNYELEGILAESIHNSAQRDKKDEKNPKERLRGVKFLLKRSNMWSIKVPREKTQNGVMMVNFVVNLTELRETLP